MTSLNVPWPSASRQHEGWKGTRFGLRRRRVPICSQSLKIVSGDGVRTLFSDPLISQWKMEN